MMQLLMGAGYTLAQIKTLDPSEPRLDEGSSALTMLVAAILAIGILLIAFRACRRDRAEN